MPQRRAFSWLALSLWTAGALAIARVVAVIANETAGRPEGAQALELCLWRLRSETTGLFWLALLCGGVVAGAALWIARRRWLGIARFGAIVSLATTLFVYVLRGWTIARPVDVAPTMSAVLEMGSPASCEGVVLSEALTLPK
jgi:hypothetical protein